MIQRPKNFKLGVWIITIGQLMQSILISMFFRMASGGHFENRFPRVATMIQHVYRGVLVTKGAYSKRTN